MSYAQESLTGPVANTKVGPIIGTFHNVTVFGKELSVNRYFGIPYAEPPVGDLRFRKPVPKQPFASTYKALKHGNACYQMYLFPLLAKGVTVSEDCLFLNVYAPVEKKEDLPVMIWTHGGGFVAGSSDTYVSDALAAYGNVIVVTFNYRLSLWGFMSTEDEHAPGNYGLFDQHLAIKWVRENIKAFGGDTSRITIFGESTGAASVVYQSLFEDNRGLFQRAIAQSGSILGKWASTKNPKHDTDRLGKLVGCTDMDSSSLVDCIKRISADSLSAALNDATNQFLTFPPPFIPNVDGEFLKETPENMIKIDYDILTSKETPFFGTLDFLTGINADEGAIMVNPSRGVDDPEHFEPNRTYFEEELIPKALSLALENSVPQVVLDIILHEYTDWNGPEDIKRIKNKYLQIYTDILSVCTMQTIDYHTSVSKRQKRTYVYQFNVKPSANFFPTPTWVEGPNHADELEYLFFDENAGIMTYMPLIDYYRPEDWETDIAEYMITLWSNFAKTGYGCLTNKYEQQHAGNVANGFDQKADRCAPEQS